MLQPNGGELATSRLTVRDVRRVNRGAVLRELFRAGESHRIALAQRTGLSSGSVTKVVASLLEEHVLVETGSVQSDGGRPRVLLRLNPDFGVVIGVEVSDTELRLASFDVAMNEIAASTFPLHPQDYEPEAFLARVATTIAESRERLGASDRRILGIGLAVPGVVDPAGDVVHHASFGWRNVPVRAALEERCSTTPSSSSTQPTPSARLRCGSAPGRCARRRRHALGHRRGRGDLHRR